MKRTFLVVLLGLATTFFTVAIAYADPSSGQATRSRGPVYTLSSLGFIILRLILWKMRAADQDRRVGASNEQWGSSKQNAKRQSNGLRSIIILGVIFIIGGALQGESIFPRTAKVSPKIMLLSFPSRLPLLSLLSRLPLPLPNRFPARPNVMSPPIEVTWG